MESLAKRLLNNPGLMALCVPEELQEVSVVIPTLPTKASTVRLRRTYNQTGLDGSVTPYWRVVGPATHPNYQSDLSIEGLKEWGII